MLDIEDVAQHLGCTVSGVRKLVARGEIRYFQHGRRGRLKFKSEWVEEFVAKHTVGPKSEEPRRAPAKPARKPKTPSEIGDVFGFSWDLLRRQA